MILQIWVVPGWHIWFSVNPDWKNVITYLFYLKKYFTDWHTITNKLIKQIYLIFLQYPRMYKVMIIKIYNPLKNQTSKDSKHKYKILPVLQDWYLFLQQGILGIEGMGYNNCQHPEGEFFLQTAMFWN